MEKYKIIKIPYDKAFEEFHRKWGERFNHYSNPHPVEPTWADGNDEGCVWSFYGNEKEE